MTKVIQHCCDEMCGAIAADDLSFRYIPKFREYGIGYANGGSYQVIKYCPWCGAKLPSSLRDSWFERLDDLNLEPEDDIPDDLNSDLWWVKGQL